MKQFFEWWQTSIVQRLPKARGFTRYYKLVKDVTIINLGSLDADTRISDAMEITKQVLKDLWYIKSIDAHVKILGHGDYAKHLTFSGIDAFSASAKEKMDKPGTVHSAPKKAPAKVSKPAVKKASAKVEKPVGKVAAKQPVIEKKITAPKTEKILEAPIVDKSAAKKTPAVKKAPAKVEKPAEKKAPAVKKAPAKVEKPVAKKAPAKKSK